MAGKQTTNPGYDVPGDGAQEQIEAARRNLAKNNPVQRNYANEVLSDDMAQDEPQCLDMMSTNLGTLIQTLPEAPESFREFAQMAEYEAFMHQPVMIRVHESRDDNDPPAVFVGCNGDSRWLPRDVNIRIPRKLVESLARAQETKYATEDNRDPNSDSMKTTKKRKMQSVSFSVLHDPSPMGSRWLRRVMQAGS